MTFESQNLPSKTFHPPRRTRSVACAPAGCRDCWPQCCAGSRPAYDTSHPDSRAGAVLVIDRGGGGHLLFGPPGLCPPYSAASHQVTHQLEPSHLPGPPHHGHCTRRGKEGGLAWSCPYYRLNYSCFIFYFSILIQFIPVRICDLCFCLAVANATNTLQNMLFRLVVYAHS